MENEEELLKHYRCLKNLPLSPQQELLHRIAFTTALVETDAGDQSFEMLYELKLEVQDKEDYIKGLYYMALSRFYAMARRVEESYLCNKMAIALLEKSNKPEELYHALTNMIFIVSLKKNLNLHDYFQRCLQLEKTANIAPSDLLYCNMAYAKLMANETDSAQYYTAVAKNILGKGPLNPHAGYRLEILQATIHYQNGEYEKESECMENAKRIATENHYLFNLKGVTKYIAENSGAKKDFEKAYYNLKQADSLQTMLLEQGLGDKVLRFDLEAKMRDRELEKNQVMELLQAKQKANVMLATCILLVVIALLVVIQKANQIHRKNLQLTEQNLNLAKKEEPRTRPDTLSDQQMQNLIERLEVLIYDKEVFKDADLSIEKLAKKLNSNRTYVSEAIKTRYHIGFSIWLNEIRINAARKLLANPKNDFLSIEGIAKEVGYGSISTFNTAFRKLSGLTPSQFKKLRDSIEKQEDSADDFSFGLHNPIV
jgi:AraC-like DNA-binding protein